MVAHLQEKTITSTASAAKTAIKATTALIMKDFIFINSALFIPLYSFIRLLKKICSKNNTIIKGEVLFKIKPLENPVDTMIHNLNLYVIH